MATDVQRPVDEARIREALDRANVASKGPWAVVTEATAAETSCGQDVCMLVGPDWIEEGDFDYFTRKDLSFMAHARDDVPDLANALLDLRAKARALALADAEINVHIAACGVCAPQAGCFCEEADEINRRWEQARNEVLAVVGREPAGGEASAE